MLSLDPDPVDSVSPVRTVMEPSSALFVLSPVGASLNGTTAICTDEEGNVTSNEFIIIVISSQSKYICTYVYVLAVATMLCTL